MNSSICIWSSRIKWTTSVTMVLILITIAYSLYIYLHTTECITRGIVLSAIILLCLAIVIAILQTPRYVSVSSEKVQIHLLCTSVRIPKEEIERIEHLPSGLAAVRIVGMGNFFGNVGLFHSDYCGRYYSFVTNPQDICLIYRRNKKPVAVSVADATIFSHITDVIEK